jgi:hypothetical protein
LNIQEINKKYLEQFLDAYKSDAPNLPKHQVKLTYPTREPVSGQAISNSSINAFTSSKSSFPNERPKRSRDFLLALYSTTLVFVVTNSASSKASPKRTFAFSTSFLL